MAEDIYRVYTDGACRGNPGPSSIGVSVTDTEGNELATASEVIGHATNNVAEYRAVIEAIELLKDLGASRVEFFMDSQLIVRQLTGEYRIRDAKMQRLAREVRVGLSALESYSFTHIPREDNKRADKLANDALDAESEML